MHHQPSEGTSPDTRVQLQREQKHLRSKKRNLCEGICPVKGQALTLRDAARPRSPVPLENMARRESTLAFWTLALWWDRSGRQLGTRRTCSSPTWRTLLSWQRPKRGKRGKWLRKAVFGRWPSLWRRATSKTLLFFQTSGRCPPLAPSSAQSSSLLSAALSEPLLTHGHTAEDYQAIYHSVEDYQAIYHSVEDYQAIYHSAEDYQAIYHSVVDPMLKTKSGNARQYNLGMGRAIKQRLLEKMSCPTLVETVDSDGRVHITKSFSAPTLKSYAPQIGVGISGEALPGQPNRKRARD
ncbi:uncharacterized protein LOC121707831 isoform X2 [Alosa sapidissima]|uniref:uncharacterized protein LOC121707831 isoform X2 n=1 Tax=Alosa sapidissima TaxID=34773 RepID=UPI001C09DB3A|nr:uncharacterized protein LOC121707831 isoform X2 [Alosa sapidissima]